jgi:hypothetical protein
MVQQCSAKGCPNTTNQVCLTCRKPFCGEHLRSVESSTWDGRQYTDTVIYLCEKDYAAYQGQSQPRS